VVDLIEAQTVRLLLRGGGDGLSVRIAGEAAEGGAESSPEDEISCALLGALVENLTMERGDNGVSGVCFRFAV